MLNPHMNSAPVAQNRKARRIAHKASKKNRAGLSKISNPPVSKNTMRQLKRALANYKKGNLAEAEKGYRQILKSDPSSHNALHGLGLVYSRSGHHEEAYASFKQAIGLEPNVADYWIAFAICLKEMHELHAAKIALARAIELEPERIEPLIELGLICILCNEGNEALDALDRAVALDPSNKDAQYLRGVQKNAFGDIESARSAFMLVLDLDPEGGDTVTTSVYWRLVELSRDKTDLDWIADRAQAALEKNIDDARAISNLHFTIALTRHRQNRYDDAFTHYAKANEVLRDSHRMVRDSISKMVDSVIEGFQPDVFDKFKDVGSESNEPIFIVGMPRSGSTLVEQIVSSHKSIDSAGEFYKLWQISGSLSKDLGGSARYPDRFGNFDPNHLAPIGEDYISALRRGRSDTAQHITDKFLNNFFNIGLIAVLFPNAPIIHCRRDPMSTCFSCYCQNFTNSHGQLVYSNSFEDLGLYYREYERLMEHWRSVLPGRMFELDYENLIDDQEGVSRSLIEHIGLPWDDACLEFYKSKKSAITASINQVRSPIYKSSVAGWRNYEKYLGPLKDALGVAE